MHYFDKWFNKTYDSNNYIPFLRKLNSNINKTPITVKRKGSKAKNTKKKKKNEESKNKKNG